MVREGTEAVQRHVRSRWGDIQCRYLDARRFEILMLEVLTLDVLALYYTSGGRFKIKKPVAILMNNLHLHAFPDLQMFLLNDLEE